MKLLLVGAGSVGAYFCGRAALGGAEVCAVVRSGFEAAATEGYHIKSIAGDFTFKPSMLCHSVSEAPEDIDLIVLATKVLPDTNCVDLLRPAADLPTHPPVLVIQNGIEIEDEIVASFPENEIIRAVAYIGAYRESVNHIVHRGSGRLIIGNADCRRTDTAEKIAKLFIKGGVPCEVTENILLERWRKLLWNLPFNPVSVLGGGLDSRELCDSGDIEKLCSLLMDEVIAVANSCGVVLTREMADGQLEYTRNFPAYKTSMLQDYEAGRQLETDAVLGNFVKIAKAHGIKVPVAECCAVLLASVARKRMGK